MALDLTRGAVWRVIPAFALPLLVGNLTQQVYNLTDSVIVGRFLGKEALAAVSASFFIYYFIISLAIGVGSGITVVVSQRFGARDHEAVRRAFSSFLLFAIVAGAVLSVVGVVGANSFFRLTRTPPEVMPYALRYFRVYAAGTLFFILFYSALSILRGIGDSVRPMRFVLVTAVLNIAFDLLFILVFRWDIEGAAAATVLAQACGVASAVRHIRNHDLLSLSRRDLVFDRPLFLQGVRIGLPTGVQQCSIAIGLVALLGIVNGFGADTLTAYGAAGKIDSFIVQIILTLAGALSAFCGQNIGAGRLDRVHAGVRFAMLFNVCLSFAVFVAILLFGQQMMAAFTEDAAVIAIGREYLTLLGAFLVFHGALCILNGAMRGAGDTFFAMVTGIVSFWLIRIPLAGLFSHAWGRVGIWWAIVASITLAFVATLVYYRAGRWKRRLKQ